MSFCRITGKSRGLPKPNYFPLLPPISPADAKRFCRITNKSQGLPGHHFIPALLGAKASRAHCRVTAKSEGQAPHHFPMVDNALKPHDVIPGYKYVFPKFDEDHKLQQRIIQLMQSKTSPGESNARYVYPVEERLTGLVIPAGLEAAVRDGEIRDLMLDKDKDTMLVKLHQGPSVAIDVSDMIVEEGMVLWDGLGPSQAVIKQRENEEKEMEKRKKKRQEGLSKRKQIFEDKEKAADEEESEMAKIIDARKSKVVKVKMRGGSNDPRLDVVVGNGPAPMVARESNNHETVFGHIVQTATAVEFFPGDSILNLPEGKVVPGQLVRNSEGVKFVPGIKAEDGRFIPGQVVMTNSGEQFVPGQVVDTRDGQKFVPGQVAETISGPKFVPGQTIETEDGPQFVPGQIIETKAGPTFIPGQIIVTDDVPRFVPGRVVETTEGPRFVPGRVIESGNQVTFVSGQVVETAEGLKFIAPDLEYHPEGGHEFSVQGFEISPEELKLLRPAASCDAATNFAIDSKMLKQLSEAGMAIGRQVPAKIPEVDITPQPIVIEKLKLDGAQALKMSQVMTVLSQVALKISQRSDLCASEIPLDEQAGDKLLLAVQKNKDLGKYLQAIVASSVVSARNNLDEESVLNAVTSALEGVLSDQCDTTLTKESILSVINNAIACRLPRQQDVKEKLMAEVGATMEKELQAKLDVVNEESVLKILNSVLEIKLGKENSTATKAVIVEAVKSGIEKEQRALYSENVSKEKFIAIVTSAIDSAAEKVSDVLSKVEVVENIRNELEKAGDEWVFSEDAVLPVIKSAIEKEVSEKGITVDNGSLPTAIMNCLKTELKRECALTEEKLLACLGSVIENQFPQEATQKLKKNDLLQAVNSAITVEKARAQKRLQSREVLMEAAEKALEKAITEQIPEHGKLLETALAKIKEEAAAKSENAERKKVLLGNLEKSVGRKIFETCSDLLNEDMALAAVDSVGELKKIPIPAAKMSAAVKSAFGKEYVMSREKFMAILNDAVEQENLFSNAAAMTALKSTVEEVRKANYESRLTVEAVEAAVESAIEAVLSQEKEMKISEAVLLSIVSAEMRKLKSNSAVTDGRIIAAVHSAIKEELAAKGEKSSIQELFLESFDSALAQNATKGLLTDEEILTTLDSAIEKELLKMPECSLTKADLMEKINAAVLEKKLKKRETFLTEKVLFDCLRSAIAEEFAVSGENASVGESLVTNINAAIEKERDAKKRAGLTEDLIVRAVASAMDSELMQNNKISLSKDELVKIAKEAITEQKSGDSGTSLTEKKLIKIVSSAIERNLSAESEAPLILKAFESAIDRERAKEKPITEKVFMEIVDSVVDGELKGTETSVAKEKLLTAIAETVDKEVCKHASMTEEAILATAYSAIVEQIPEGNLNESLLSGIDSVVESKRETRKLISEEIVFEAVKSIADEFTKNPESKACVLNAVTSALEKARNDNNNNNNNNNNNSDSPLVGENLLKLVCGAVENHFADNGEIESSRKAFMSAISSAIAQEQQFKRGALTTKESLKAAVSSAVQEEISRNPALAPIKETLLTAASSAVENQCSPAKHLTEKALLSAISSSIGNFLCDISNATHLGKIVDSMEEYLNENLGEVMVGTVNYMVANESALDKLKYAVNNAGETIHVLEKLSSVLNDNMGEAFQKLSAGDPGLLNDVIEKLQVEKLSSKEQATEVLQKAIIGAVRQKSCDTLKNLMEEGKDFKDLLLQSVGLARALGMNQVASVLLDVVSDSKSHEVLANDETIIDILQRLTIMRQFAEMKPELASALRQLISDPELAKRDPALRELVRHSTALMTVPEETLQSSADIPASLLMSDNTLAMEQYLAKARRPRTTLLIVKHGLQAVVPKEASRAVLTGQVPYAVLDEKGIKYFEPLHVFSTMKLPYYASHCFSMYRSPDIDYETEWANSTSQTPRGSFSSAEDCFNNRKNLMLNWDKGFDKHFPKCKRVAELCKKPVTGDEQTVYRTNSASRILDFGKRSEFKSLRDIYD